MLSSCWMRTTTSTDTNDKNGINYCSYGSGLQTSTSKSGSASCCIVTNN